MTDPTNRPDMPYAPLERRPMALRLVWEAQSDRLVATSAYRAFVDHDPTSEIPDEYVRAYMAMLRELRESGRTV